MEAILGFFKALSPDLIFAIVAGVFGFLNLGKKFKDVGAFCDELSSALEDGKLERDELKKLSAKATALFGKK